MAFMLLPAMPGGPVSDLSRVQYIASHPLLFKLGWFPWQLSALSDFIIAVAFLRLEKISLSLRLLLFSVTLIAIAPDQIGQFLWVTEGVNRASEAIRTASLSVYLNFEKPVYIAICGWAALLYTLLAIIWSIALSKAGIAGAALNRFSYLLWSASFLCSLLFLISPYFSVPFLVLAAGNALFFSGLTFWFCWVIESILRIERPQRSWGRQADWRLSENFGALKIPLEIIANSCFLRRMFELIPPIPLSSKIDSVVYLNWLISAQEAEALLPEGLELQRLGPNGEYALFSILTFRHQKFGPQFLRPLADLSNVSAIVSNWRIHVTDPLSGLQGIYFISNTCDNLLVSLGARLFSEGMPMHFLNRASLNYSKDGSYACTLVPGKGSSAPDLEFELAIDRSLEESSFKNGPWGSCFGSFENFLAYCVPQERSISSQDYLNRISFQEIRLEINTAECRAISGKLSSKTKESISSAAIPFCFAAPDLHFRFDKEHYRRV